MRPSLTLQTLGLVLVTACSATPRAPSQHATLRSTRAPITSGEIATIPAMDAYEVIRLLRPTYLHSRGPTSFRSAVSPYPAVYVDGVRAGGLDQLRGIPSASIREIRFYSASDATTRWGTGHTAGVIHVATKR